MQTDSESSQSVVLPTVSPCSEVASDPPLAHDQQLPGYWMWGILLIAVAIFELWAVWTKHRTLSQTVQHGPRWFKWAMALGLVALIAHLFM